MCAFWRSLAGRERTTIRAVVSRRAVVVHPGEGHRVGNVEFLARSIDTPRLNLGVITMQPARGGPPMHEHTDEDDAFYVLEGEMTFLLEDKEILAGSGTFVLVPPGVQHTFANRSDAVARMLNIHAPAGFDLRLESD
jgi:mannose-6-phosphate isomerase-like protein (cupin superfamily)